MSRDLLAQLLKDAAKAHHEHEIESGKPDADWPAWYAGYIFNALGDGATDGIPAAV